MPTEAELEDSRVTRRPSSLQTLTDMIETYLQPTPKSKCVVQNVGHLEKKASWSGERLRESEISPPNSTGLHGRGEFCSSLGNMRWMLQQGMTPLGKGHQSCLRRGYWVELHCWGRKALRKPASRSLISVLASLSEPWVLEDQPSWWAFKAQGYLFPSTSYPPFFQSSGDNYQPCALSLSLCTFRSSVPGCWELYLSYFKEALAVGCCGVTGTMLGTSSFASGPLCSSDQVCPAPAGVSLHFWFDCHAVPTLPPYLLLSQLQKKDSS